MLSTIWIYSLVSVFAVSLISLIGVFVLKLKIEKLRKILLLLVSFSAGALLGDAFIHLLPEAVEENGFTLNLSFYILIGFLLFFVIEKFIHWHHCHLEPEHCHPHTFAYMNLFGDSVHNFIDGLIIGASYLVSIPVGIATTLAVIFHEIPQEIGDFGVMVHGGFSTKKALFMNFLTALTAIIGVVIAIVLSSHLENISGFLIPFAAGGFLYIAASDLIPELKKETKISKSILQFITFILGILVMYSLIFFE